MKTRGQYIYFQSTQIYMYAYIYIYIIYINIRIISQDIVKGYTWHRSGGVLIIFVSLFLAVQDDKRRRVRRVVTVLRQMDKYPSASSSEQNEGGGESQGSVPRPMFSAGLHNNLAHLEEPVMSLLEKTLSAQPTDSLTPYLLSSNTLLDTSALKLSISAIPASPLSWT